MASLLSLVPLVLMLGLYAGAIKVAAWLLRRTRVSWRQSLLYAFVLTISVVLVRFLLGIADLGMPLLPSLFVGFLLQVGLGALFFRNRGTTSAGMALGPVGGAQLAATSFCLLVVGGGVLFIVGRAFLPTAP